MLSASFGSHGDPVAGQNQALNLIDKIVTGQAALLSYSELFFYVAVLFICSLPLLLLLGGNGGAKAAEAAAAAH
jgi:DHA2 family multidrug resistance protein